MNEQNPLPPASDVERSGPDLSVVVVVPATFAQAERTILALAAQTIADRIELVVVAPRADALPEAGAATSGFHSTQVVAAGAIANVDHASAHGLLAASAPIVASIEDHAYPEPDWAEELLQVWDADCVAVGSAMRNANPRSRLSWSNILIAYGQWFETAREGDMAWVALHNGSFRRAALEPYGDALPGLFNREAEVLQHLKRNGGRFRFAPKARIRHLNPSSLAATARLRVDAGRLTAANRARTENWGRMKRLLYAAFGPAIPLVRYARMRRELFGPGKSVGEVRHGADLLIGLCFDAAGQMAGFLAGPGAARDRLATFEMDRLAHLDARDRMVFAPRTPAG